MHTYAHDRSACEIVGGNINIYFTLIHKQLETHWCPLNTVATDVLALKHQDISIQNADNIFIVLVQFHTEILQL